MTHDAESEHNSRTATVANKIAACLDGERTSVGFAAVSLVLARITTPENDDLMLSSVREFISAYRRGETVFTVVRET